MPLWKDIGAQFKLFSTLPVEVALESQQNPSWQNCFQTWNCWILHETEEGVFTAQMSVKHRDIRGAACHKCGKGKARVVHYTLPSGKERFFFGCDNSTEAQKCPGSTNWQPIQVPEEVIEEVGLGHLLQTDKKKKGKKEKREKGETVRVEIPVCDGDALIVTVKTEKVKGDGGTQKKRKSARGGSDDDDDDYVEGKNDPNCFT